MKINLPRLSCCRIFYQNGNHNRRSCSLTKDVIFFFAANLSWRSRIPSQMEKIQATELFSQTLTQPVSRVRVDIATISHKTDYTLLTDTVTRPANSSNIGVIECILVGRSGTSGIRLCNPLIEHRIFYILVIIVRRFLTGWVRRIPDNHPNIQSLLPFTTFTVIYQNLTDQIILLIHFKGICQANPFKWRVLWFFRDAVIHRLNINGGNVIG